MATMEEAMDGELYNAMDCNDLETINRLIAEGRTLNEFYYDSRAEECVSLLHLACRKGRYECVLLFLENNVTLDIADRLGHTPLMYALSSGHLDIAELLLQKDPSLAYDEDVFGRTAMDNTAMEGNADGVRLLVKYGANVNHQTLDGVTVVMRCVKEALVADVGPVLTALVEAGADINMRDKLCKRSVLQIAALKMNVKAIEVLLAAGADMYTVDCGAKTPLTNLLLQHVRTRLGVLHIHEDVWTILLMMVHAGIDFSRSVCEDSNPMFTAAFLKAEPLIRFFLANGADPNTESVLGMTTLLKATSKNDLGAVKTLVEWNCRLDIKGKYYKKSEDYEYTVDAFELAIMLGHFDIAKFLIEAGYLDFQKPYLFGKARLPKSLEFNTDMILWLHERCANPDPLWKLAVLAVRRSMGRDIVSNVRRLPVPPRLRRMLVLMDLLQLEVEY